MGIHSDTRNQLVNKDNLSDSLKQSVNTLIELVENNSPLTDINSLLSKNKINLENITIIKQGRSWIPIRNVLRLIAYIVKISDEIINTVFIQSMYCGCDYFSGEISINTISGNNYSGRYKWQWTRFEDNKKNFDKFIEFPVKIIQKPMI